MTKNLFVKQVNNAVGIFKKQVRYNNCLERFCLVSAAYKTHR